MASLKEIKSRIASVKNTLKITSAMKLVASAKLHKVQSVIGNKLPYEQMLHSILSGILQDDDFQKAMHEELGLKGNSLISLQDVSRDAIPRKENASRVAVVAFSSNSSLIGSFNANVIKCFDETMDLLKMNGYGMKDIDIYIAGRKLADSAGKKGLQIYKAMPELADRPDYKMASDLADELADRFASGEISHVILVYNHFSSMSSQPSVRENYLPIALQDYNEGDIPDDFIIEPDPLELVRNLLPLVLSLKIYTVSLDASAAEHSARTVAMQIATDNARNLLSELTLAYNKGRQQEITSEILDLVGGSLA